jgi:hypothetical protein
VPSRSGPESAGSTVIKSGSSTIKGGAMSLLAGNATSVRYILGGAILIQSGSSVDAHSGSVSSPGGDSGLMSIGTEYRIKQGTQCPSTRFGSSITQCHVKPPLQSK